MSHHHNNNNATTTSCFYKTNSAQLTARKPLDKFYKSQVEAKHIKELPGKAFTDGDFLLTLKNNKKIIVEEKIRLSSLNQPTELAIELFHLDKTKTGRIHAPGWALLDNHTSDILVDFIPKKNNLVHLYKYKSVCNSVKDHISKQLGVAGSTSLSSVTEQLEAIMVRFKLERLRKASREALREGFPTPSNNLIREIDSSVREHEEQFTFLKKVINKMFVEYNGHIEKTENAKFISVTLFVNRSFFKEHLIYKANITS